MRVDLADDAQLHVIDGQGQERVVVDEHQRPVGVFVLHLRPVVGVDEWEHTVGHHTGLGQLTDDGLEDVDETLLGPLSQDESGSERRDGVRGVAGWVFFVAILPIRVHGVHEPTHQGADIVALHRVSGEPSGVRPDIVDVLMVGNEPGVEHVEFDGDRIDGIDASHGEVPGVVVQVDRCGGSEQVPPDGGMTRWPPG